MTGKQVLIIGGIAAGMFYMLTRSSAQAATLGERRNISTITTTKGEKIQLREDSRGLLVDQYGGIWA